MIALVVSALLSGPVTGAVNLRAEAQIVGTTVELAEIADVRGVDADATRRLSELTLGPAPASGIVRGVRREEIAALVRAAGITVSLGGSAICRTTAKVEKVTGVELEDAARKALVTLFAGRDVELELVRGASDLIVPMAERRREVDVDLGRREALPGSWNVPVDIRIDGTRVQTAWIAMDVKLYQEMPVATRDLLRGEAVDAACWSLKRTLVESAGPRPVQPETLFGATCAREISAGTRITEFDVRRDPLVRSGDLVELEVVRGPLRARCRAVARGQGARGDRVEVQSGEGQRRLVGIVVERGLVRVDMAGAPRNER